MQDPMAQFLTELDSAILPKVAISRRHRLPPAATHVDEILYGAVFHQRRETHK